MKLNIFRFFILIMILSGLWICSNATAQIVPCAVTDPSSESIIALEKRLLKLKSQFVKNAQTSGVTEVQYIPIKAHIIRKSDGTGGLSLADLNTALVQVNRHFQNIGLGLQLYFAGLPHIINNTTYYDYINTDEQALLNTNSVSNAINIYFPNSISFGSMKVAGYAYFPSKLSISNNLFVQAQVATDNHTFAHEMGHYFNLLHTFQNSDNTNNEEREYVTRSPAQGANCTLKGDLLCDTPADPYGRDSVTIQGCTYTGTARDPQGQLYAPSLSNIMSYYPLSCGSDFTPGQSARMADGFLLRTDPSNQYNFSGGSTVTGGSIPGNLTAKLLASGCSLTFDDNSSDEAGFVIERSSISAAEGFMPIGGLPPNTTNYIDQTITSYTNYYYRVKASNSSVQYSEVLPVSTALNYCVPKYTYPCSTTAVLINEFVLKQGTTTIINNKDSNCSPANYGDYTSTAYPVTAGNTYTFTIGQSAGTYYDQHVSVWADFDQDGYFELNERVYRSDSLASMPRMNPTASGSFLIPSSVQGLVRVRVRSGYNFGAGSAVTDPCGLLSFGEAEDYMLQVTSMSPPTITTNTVTPSPVCAGSTINVGFTAVNLSSTSYAVQLSDNTGNNFITLPTTGTASPLIAEIPVNITSGTGYKVRVISNSPSVTGSASSTFTINALPSPPGVVTPVSYCQGQTASALSAVGTNLKWYLAASGGVGSSTAPTPSTASSGTLSYWVTQTVNSCESTRTKIDVVVTAPPSPPGVVTPVSYCQGQTASALSAVGTNLKWYLAASGGVGSSTAPTPSTASSGTLSYWVTQTVNSCESTRTKIDVVVT
ncbi:GEVED domain-containing protein, partial [Runella salmonicolor]